MATSKHHLRSLLIIALLATAPIGASASYGAHGATPVRGSHAPGLHTRLVRSEQQVWLELRTGTKGPATITLSDAAGRVVLREEVHQQGTYRRTIPATSTDQGFTLRIEQEGVTVLRKLVIEQG
jgi:hypothetical protein